MLNKIKRFFKKNIISDKDKLHHDFILGSMNTGKVGNRKLKSVLTRLIVKVKKI